MARRLTARGEQRRSELIAYATERFASAGYHTTSVAELCDGLGVGKGVFYWYFESKEQLFIEILREGQRALRRAQRDAISGVERPLERVQLGIQASLRWWADHRDLYHLIQFATTETTFRPAIRQGEKTHLADLVTHIEAGIADGTIPDRDPEVLAQAVLGVTATMARTQVINAGRNPDEVAAEVTDFCLHGIVGAPAPV